MRHSPFRRSQLRIAPPYDGAKIRSVRRLFSGRIRYFRYYRVMADAVDALAVWHASRDEPPTRPTENFEIIGN
jgi:plasmid stabilization system protein ParE